MDTLLDLLFNRAHHLFARAGGPLNFRLVVMPTVVTILAILADRRDAREGRPALLGAFVADPGRGAWAPVRTSSSAAASAT